MLLKRRIQRYFQFLQSEIVRQNEELIWANVWHDTAKGISWLNDGSVSFSPGRWAVGYNYLYVMTRILNDLLPSKILEFGLGVSTTLISEYFKHIGGGENYHLVLEHDEDWIGFYTRSHQLSPTTKIIKQELQKGHSDGRIIYKYKNLSNDIRGKRFQVISIDAPFGGEKDSRSDIVNFLPDVLEEDFVIVVDDVNRSGEMQTIEKIKNKLEQNKIESVYSIYKSSTDLAVICSKSNRFFCSL